MNERIRELAEQATKYAFEWAEGDSKINPKITPDKWLKAYQEKFAELIVRECINEIHVADVGDLKGKSYYLDKVAEHIEKHFGVEE